MIACHLKLELRPAQERQLTRWLWNLTGVWNWAIRKIEQDAKDGIYYTRYDFMALVNGHSRTLGIPSNAINGMCLQAHQAWKDCFAKVEPRSDAERIRTMICSDCNEPIRKDDKTASGEDGVIHYQCFKRGTAQGREINTLTLMEDIGRLKRRVQDLERQVEMHDRNIDFRIGGA